MNRTEEESSLSQLLFEGVHDLFRELGRGKGGKWRREVLSAGIVALSRLDPIGRQGIYAELEQRQAEYDLDHPASFEAYRRAILETVALPPVEKSARRRALREAADQARPPILTADQKAHVLAILDDLRNGGVRSSPSHPTGSP